MQFLYTKQNQNPMKTQPVLFLLLVVCFSCGTNNKPLSDSQKEKVISEVKPVVNEIIRGAQEANMDLIAGSTYDSPDYTYIYGGKVYSYKELTEGFKPVFATLSNQKVVVASEKYAVLDKSTVLYTLVAKWEMNFKDGHSVIQEPWVNQFLFKKIDGKWKVVSTIESGYEQVDKVSKDPKELNQMELAKQFLGRWKCEFNDTTMVFDQKPYGKMGQDVLFKLSTKGKPIAEGRQLLAYDNKMDRIVITSITKDVDMWVGSLMFNSQNKYSYVFGGDMYHPESALYKGEGEIVSPDKYVENIIKGDKVIRTFTYTRIK
jgi:hypothetical protein